MLKKLVAIWLTVAMSSYAYSGVDVYEFSSEDDRRRYQRFIEELRCPKCQSNNLAGTNSQIAMDLRRELHRMVDEGKTDEEIIDFMVVRYGDYVLYRPPIQPNTVALWAGPIVFLGIGTVVVGVVVWRRRQGQKQSQYVLNDDEKRRLDELLSNDSKATSSKTK